MLLSTATDVNAWVAALCAVITTILIPIFCKWQKRRKEAQQKDEAIVALPQQLDSIQNSLSDIKEDQNIIKYNQQVQDKRLEKLEKRYDALETQQLKYIINDAFFSCNGHVEDMPYEMLVNAAECADIYLKKGLNHETGARCKIIYAEMERRATAVIEEDETNA